MKSIFVDLNICTIASDYIFSLSSRFSLNKKSYISFVTEIAVNMLTIRPIERVTANPFIGPVPNWNKKTEAISVVIFASKIVQKTF